MTAHPRHAIQRTAQVRRQAAQGQLARLRRRRAVFEQLEDRALLTALPFGAYPDDTGEYMLGDVQVTVVLMESDPTISPRDNLPVGSGGIGAPVENWTAGAIAAVKSNIQAGLDWWKNTLDAMPTVRDGLLNFNINWTYADTPVRTGYEPIARTSNDFALWIYDFLNFVGFNQSGNFSTDIRAFNNFQRQQTNADWAFTIFVVNNATDADKLFAPGGSFSRAFSFAGGRFMVVPADRPASTYAHEAGHMFWALDEYAGASNYTDRRGYYNTQNTNAANNPGAPGQPFVQQPSIMATGALLDQAYLGLTSSQSSFEMIGWRDSDGDGIFDVLDVPFTLTGSGRYNSSTGIYRFIGSSKVNTLANQNPSGTQNDITINRIRQVEYSINGGPWLVAQTFADRTYSTALDLSIAVPAGNNTIKIRTVDTRTGVTSNEFVGTTTAPSQTDVTGIAGFVFHDVNGNGVWDSGESALSDWAVTLVDAGGAQVQLVRGIEPNNYVEGTVLNTIIPQATLSTFGGDTYNDNVTARSSVRFPSAQRVFFNNRLATGLPDETWNASRKLRVQFSAPVSTVSLRALSSGGTSFGRLDAFNAAGELVARYTTSALTAGKSELMRVSSAAGDIVRVEAYGHMASDVLLDSLTFGPGSSTTTNAQGAWSLPNLLTGNYRVKVTVPASYVVTTAGGAIVNLPYSTGQSGVNVSFGLKTSSGWRNPSLPENVNGDPLNTVNGLDLLLIVNWLVANPGNPSLPPDGEQAIYGYLDVDGNGVCNALDLLAVVTYIVNHPLGGGGEGEPVADSLLGPMGVGPAEAEGETPAATPQTAAEYYAQNPLHLQEIPGTDLPCCCDECLTAPAVESAVATLQTPANTIPPGSSSAESVFGAVGALLPGTAKGSVSGKHQLPATAGNLDSFKPGRRALDPSTPRNRTLVAHQPERDQREATADSASARESSAAAGKLRPARRGTIR